MNWPTVILILGILYFILGAAALCLFVWTWKQVGKDLDERLRRHSDQCERVEKRLKLP
jgi:hypothetical protein